MSNKQPPLFDEGEAQIFLRLRQGRPPHLREFPVTRYWRRYWWPLLCTKYGPARGRGAALVMEALWDYMSDSSESGDASEHATPSAYRGGPSLRRLALQHGYQDYRVLVDRPACGRKTRRAATQGFLSVLVVEGFLAIRREESPVDHRPRYLFDILCDVPPLLTADQVVLLPQVIQEAHCGEWDRWARQARPLKLREDHPVTDRDPHPVSDRSTGTTTITGTGDPGTDFTNFTTAVLAALREALPDWTVMDRDQRLAAELWDEGYTAEQVVNAIRERAARADVLRKRAEGKIRGLAYFAKAIRGDVAPEHPPVSPARVEDEAPPLSILVTGNIQTPEQAIWQSALSQIQLQVTRADYDTWIRETTVISCADGQWVIGAPHMFAREWLENRLHGLVRKTLTGLVGAAVEVEFVVQPPSGPSHGEAIAAAVAAGV